jgi:pimeloyl-ACP methyl ester carboxylesterase
VTSPKPRFVAAGEKRLRLWSVGDGPAAVVLPGLIRAASVVAAELAARAPDLAFHVFELPGLGASATAAGASLDEDASTLAAAMAALGLAGAPVVGCDLAAPLAARLQAPRALVDLDVARAWAKRSFSPPDLTPRDDGAHLTALHAFLRNAHVLEPATGRRAARQGDPLPSPDALDAMTLAAAEDPRAYARLWASGLAALGALTAEAPATWDTALALVRASASRVDLADAPVATSSDVRRDYVETPRGRVHVRVAGPNARPLIALHSAPGSAAPLRPILEGLAASRRVIAPDYLGNGDSDKPDAPVDIATLGRDVLALADALGLETFDLFGTHTGALIALEAAIQAPQRVGRAILEAPPLLSPAFAADLLQNYFPELRPDGWGLHLLQAWNMRRDMFLFWPWYRAQRSAARPLEIPDAQTLHDWTLGLLTSGRTYHRTYRAAFEYDTAARLPLLRRPALLCAGPSDMLADGLAAARQLINAQSEVRPTPATVWYPKQERAASEETLAIYQAFLNRTGN